MTDSAQGNLNINRTSIAGIPAQREAFDYDSIGNWKQYLRQTEGSTTLDQKRTSNRDNQLTELDANSDGLAYDAAGNMTACRPDKDGDWNKGYTIVWDAWNRIVQVKNAQTSATVATYAYDGLTRRTTTTIGSTVRHFYYNNLWKCVEERLNTSTNPDRVYYWALRKGHRDELLRRDRATSGSALDETLWCLMDYFDPIAIADTSGTIQERYTYSAFGLASLLTPAFTPRTTTTLAWNFLFHGQFRDTETGWDNYGYRYYLPWLGRWPTRDLIWESGGLHIYTFVHNEATNYTDYMGLSSFPGDGVGPPQIFDSSDDAGKNALNDDKDRTRESDDPAKRDKLEKETGGPQGYYGWEYCGLICKSCIKGKAYYASTGPRTDRSNTCNPDLAPCPSGWEKVGEHHSQPDSSTPSRVDHSKIPEGMTGYVGSATGMGPDYKYQRTYQEKRQPGGGNPPLVYPKQPF